LYLFNNISRKAGESQVLEGRKLLVLCLCFLIWTHWFTLNHSSFTLNRSETY